MLAQCFLTAIASGCKGVSPIHYAARDNRCRALRSIFLIRPDGHLLRDRLLRIPLHLAANSGAFDAIQLLVTAAPETLQTTDEETFTPFDHASFAGQVAVLQRAVAASHVGPWYSTVVGTDLIDNKPSQPTPAAHSKPSGKPSRVSAIPQRGTVPTPAIKVVPSKPFSKPSRASSQSGGTSLPRLTPRGRGGGVPAKK